MPHANLPHLLNRIPEGPKTTKLRAAVADVLEVAVSFRAKAKAIDTDPGLTQLGRLKALAEAAKAFLPALRSAHQPVADAAAALKARRDQLKIAAPDPKDLGSALERQEIRSMLRAMKSSERKAFLLANKDERFADAVLSAPAQLSGIDERTFDEVLQATKERRFGPQIAEIEADEQIVAEADNARQMASDEIQSLTGLDNREFANLARNVPAGRPWLVRDGDAVRRVVPGESTYPLATADEVARGRFYASKEEFDADNPRLAVVA